METHSALPDFIVRFAEVLGKGEASRVAIRNMTTSWVLLADSFAYKVKKPLKAQFIDNSTLELRREHCQAEVRLNRRLCRDLYLGVVNVEPPRGAADEQVEPAVWMRRLPDEGMLEHLLLTGLATTAHVTCIAETLARFHDEVGSLGSSASEAASAAAIRTNWQHTLREPEWFVSTLTSLRARTDLEQRVERFVDAHATLFVKRIEHGRIRDCHGDLHVGSVCFDGSGVYLFDCLEFNTMLRRSDIAAEIAFLAMDLDFFGRRDLAEAFISIYISHSGDSELLLILNFYKCYRAYIRGKIWGMRLRDSTLSNSERAVSKETAKAYFELAREYANAMSKSS